jgi:hypothetical protein
LEAQRQNGAHRAVLLSAVGVVAATTGLLLAPISASLVSAQVLQPGHRQSGCQAAKRVRVLSACLRAGKCALRPAAGLKHLRRIGDSHRTESASALAAGAAGEPACALTGRSATY